jgi:hypothetical protein
MGVVCRRTESVYGRAGERLGREGYMHHCPHDNDFLESSAYYFLK